MLRRRLSREYALPSAGSRRRWRRKYSTRRFLLVIALTATGVCLLTWGLISAKGSL